MEILVLASAMFNISCLCLQHELMSNHEPPVHYYYTPCTAQNSVLHYNSPVLPGFGYYTQRTSYTRQELCTFRNMQTVSPSTVRSLDNLRIHVNTKSKRVRVFPKKRGKRSGRRKNRSISVVFSRRTEHKQTNSVNHINLQNLVHIDFKTGALSAGKRLKNVSNNFQVSLLNIQSVGTKSNLVQDFIADSGADIVFLTETWLLEKGDEVRVSNMTPSDFRCQSFPRCTGLGGGICVFFRDILLKYIQNSKISDFKTFEC